MRRCQVVRQELSFSPLPYPAAVDQRGHDQGSIYNQGHRRS
jgi:hypothetical protein